MFGNNKKQGSNPSTTAAKPTKQPGTSYDLCRKVKQEDGSEKLQRIGNVFIRASGTGGVAFITEEDGTKHELPIFARSKRSEARKQGGAAEQVAASAA